MIFLKKNPFFLSLFFISLIFCYPLFKENAFFMMHDGMHHLLRVVHYFFSMKEGQFPVYWAGFMNKTFGSPIFVYTPPLFYIFSSIFKLLGFETFLSLKIVIGLLNLIFMLGCYFLLRLFFSAKASFFGTILLSFSPYRISQLYVRGALSEFTSLSFFPLFLFFLNKSFEKRAPLNVKLLASILFSFMLLSHILTPLILAPVVLIYLFIACRRLKNLIPSVKNVLIIFGFSFLLSSFIYFPILFEIKHVKFFLATSHVYKDHFLKFWQLFDPGWGFGFSMPGTKDDGMSFQLGVFNWVVVFTIAFCFALKYLRKKSDKNRIAYLFLLTFFLSIFLMLDFKINRFLYEKIFILQSFQFPWRLLNLSIVSVSYLGAYIFDYFNPSKKKTLLICFLILVISTYYLKTNIVLDYSDDELLHFGSDSTFTHEFTPIWRVSTADREYVANQKIYSINQEIAFEDIEIRSNRLKVKLENDKSAVVRIDTLYFPGLRVFDNNQEIKYKVLTLDDNILKEKRDISGLIEFSLQPGKHLIKLKYTRTFFSKIGFYLSLISWIVIFFFMGYNIMRSQLINKNNKLFKK